LTQGTHFSIELIAFVHEYPNLVGIFHGQANCWPSRHTVGTTLAGMRSEWWVRA